MLCCTDRFACLPLRSCVCAGRMLCPASLLISTEHHNPEAGRRDMRAVSAAWGCGWGHSSATPSPVIRAPVLPSDLAQIQQRVIPELCCNGATPSAWQGDIWLLWGGCRLCEGWPVVLCSGKYRQMPQTFSSVPPRMGSVPLLPHCCSTLSSTLITLLCFHSRSPSPLQATEKEKESPTELAERCLRELLGRAAYGNIKNAITPVLM